MSLFNPIRTKGVGGGRCWVNPRPIYWPKSKWSQKILIFLNIRVLIILLLWFLNHFFLITMSEKCFLDIPKSNYEKNIPFPRSCLLKPRFTSLCDSISISTEPDKQVRPILFRFRPRYKWLNGDKRTSLPNIWKLTTVGRKWKMLPQ